MNVHEFAGEVRKEVVDSNLDIYKDLFRNTTIDEATDEYWKQALRFFQGLDEGQREILFKITRQVMVDTVSNLFGVLDGVSRLGKQDREFRLTHGDEPLNGDLQDVFLEMEE